MKRIIQRSASVTVAIFLSLESGAIAQASVIYVRASATGANNGTSWADAYTNLQTALGAAQAGDQIWVAAGTYMPAGGRSASFEMLSGVAIYGGFAGTETQLEQRDFLLNYTALDGGGTSFHVVRATNVDAGGILDGFVVRSGSGSGGTGIDKNGAGLLIVGGLPVFRNCTIRENVAHEALEGTAANGGDGGGAYISGNASPLFQHCAFASNRAGVGGSSFGGEGGRGGDGGAVWANGGVIRFEGCHFAANRSGNGGRGGNPVGPGGGGGNGGAIFASNGAVELIDCQFTDNLTGDGALSGSDFPAYAIAGSGGALSATSASVWIDNCAFSANQTGESRGGDGGAVFIETSPASSISSSLFDANICGRGDPNAGNGGAVSVTQAALTIADSTFRNNRAGDSGGWFSSGARGGSGGALFQSGGDLTVDRCEFSDNRAGSLTTPFGLPPYIGGSGGAMVLSSATVRDAKFLRNAAGTAPGSSSVTNGSGGATHANGPATFVNCVFADNSAPGTTATATGGAIHAQADLVLVNCTIAENFATGGTGGGVNLVSEATVENCIFWSNSDVGGTGESAQIYGSAPGTINYSIVDGWTGFLGGTGNSGADPMFADTSGDDFGLSPGSPAIDAGSNSAVPAGIVFDVNGNPRFVDDPGTPDSGSGTPPIVDKGAAEFGSCLGDTDADQDVDLADLAVLLSSFGASGPGLAGDLDADGDVDLADLAVLLSRFGQTCL